ncbi:hypothetical protein Tco_1236419 [Tanacetum coccineum]
MTLSCVASLEVKVLGLLGVVNGNGVWEIGIMGMRWMMKGDDFALPQDHPLTLTPKFGPGVTPGARLTRVVSLCVEQDAVLAEDTIVERKTSSTRRPAGAAPLRRKKGGVIRDNLE